MIDASRVVEIAAALSGASKLGYYSLVGAVVSEFLKARSTNDDRMLESAGLTALWTALNHPQSGPEMRVRLSQTLRETGKAHITWHFGRDGLAIAQADRFVDLEAIAAVAPKNAVTMVATPDGKPGTQH